MIMEAQKNPTAHFYTPPRRMVRPVKDHCFLAPLRRTRVPLALPAAAIHSKQRPSSDYGRWPICCPLYLSFLYVIIKSSFWKMEG